MKAIVDKPFSGAPDGAIQANDFVKGDVVEGDLARVAVEQNWATEVAEELPLEAKDAGGAPENKMERAAPENKRKRPATTGL